MIYKTLYDMAVAYDGRLVVFDATDGKVPFDGWFVASGVDFDPNLSISIVENFDDEINDILTYIDAGDKVGVAIRDGLVYTGRGHVFASKEYAMGYAHGAGVEGIYEVGVGKVIKRR